MADFTPALENTLHNEGGFYHSAKTGEVSNYGISLRFLRDIGARSGTGEATPEDIAFVRAITREQAASWYLQYFWLANHLDRLCVQAVANKAFDLCVNMGSTSAIRLLQQACNLLSDGKPLVMDGEAGPKTIAAVNAIDPDALLAKYREVAKRHYQLIAAANPAEAPALPEWLARLAA